MNLRGFLLAALFAAVAAVGLVMLFFVVTDDTEAVTSTGEGQTIYAKALNDHGCDSGEWHFVINQVRLGQAHAPAGITVTFGNGNTVGVPLEKFTGEVAHYTTYGNLDSVVVQATARIYASWSGQFNLSHGPCGVPTPTPTPTVTPTPTPTTPPTPTATATPTSTPTATPASTPTPTNTLTPTPIPVATSVTQAPQPVSMQVTGSAPACETEPMPPFGIFLIAIACLILFVGGMFLGAGIARSGRR